MRQSYQNVWENIAPQLDVDFNDNANHVRGQNAFVDRQVSRNDGINDLQRKEDFVKVSAID